MEADGANGNGMMMDGLGPAGIVMTMSPIKNLRLLSAAERLDHRVHHLATPCRGRRGLLHADQLRESAHSISANIAEGYGRITIGERNNKLRIARGEAEETLEHLRLNFAMGRLERADFFATQNVATVIIKMIDAVLSP